MHSILNWYNCRAYNLNIFVNIVTTMIVIVVGFVVFAKTFFVNLAHCLDYHGADLELVNDSR